MAKKIDVAGRLHCVAVDNILAGANEILDDNEQKKQSQINAELIEAVENLSEEMDTKQGTITAAVTPEIVEDSGDPEAAVTFQNNNLQFSFKNLKGEKGNRGNGITSIVVEMSQMDGEPNTVTIKTTDNPDGQTFSVRNGRQGPQGDSVLVGQGDLPLAHVLGQDNTKAMSQKGVTDVLRPVKAKAETIIEELEFIPKKVYDQNTDCAGGVLKANKTVDTSTSNYVNNYRTTGYIPLNGLNYIVYKDVFVNTSGWAGLLILNSSGTVLANLGGSGTVDMSNYPTADKMRFCYEYSKRNTVSVMETDVINPGKNKIEKLEESAATIAQIEESLYVDNGNGRFGEYTGNTPSTQFGTAATILTVGNSQSTISKGYLKEIRCYVHGAGTYTFYVGYIDQNNIAQNMRSFQVALTSGLNVKDLYDRKIIINEGEQLFIRSTGSTTVARYYKPSAKFDYEVWKASSLTSEFSPFSVNSASTFPNGICMNFSWTIDGVMQDFVKKDEMNEVSAEIDSLNDKMNSLGVVFDTSKNPYKIVVHNGQLVPRSLNFSNVLVIGNSLTCHQQTDTYLTHGYAMAASSLETSWTYQLQRVLRQYNSNAVVTPFCGVAWESNPNQTPANITNRDGGAKLSTYLNDSIDCIIIRIGENYNHQPSVYKSGLQTLVNYLATTCPMAEIIICSLFWHNTGKDAAFREVADENALKYIATGSEVGTYKAIMGDYLYNQDRTAKFPIVGNAVAGHMTDLAFYLWNRILVNALGYRQLPEELHKINVTSNVDFNLRDKKNGVYYGVYQGLISIHTYEENAPTVVVKDASNNTITVEAHDMSSVEPAANSSWNNKPTYVFTFDMPDSDVNVTITAQS